MKPPAALLLCLALAACRTTTTTTLFGSPGDGAGIEHLTPARGFRLSQGEELAGYLVQFDGEGEDAASVFSVRNRWHQELGRIDGLGRAWRHRPHRDEPEWLGSGTVLEGARRILEAGADLRLDEVELAHLGRPRG